jgi:hypothetical protein
MLAMRAWWLVVASVSFGGAFGYGMTWNEFRPRPLPESKPVVDPSQGTPRIVLPDSTFYEFGRVPQGVPQHHVYRIQNQGNAPLILTLKSKQCHCTLADLGADENTLTVPPGGEAPVALSLDGSLPGGAFSKSVVLTTNDPTFDELTLMLQGTVVLTVHLMPENLIFSALSPTEPTVGTVKVYSFHQDPLEIVGHAFDQPSGADHLSVEIRPLPAEDLVEQQARSGYEVLVTVQPGLPLGPLEQRLVIDTNLEAPRQLFLPVVGRVTGDISVHGRAWSKEDGVARLGLVSSAQGLQQEFTLVVRGEHRASTRFSVEKLEPEWLQVEIVDPQGSSSVSRVKLHIPPGSPIINRTGGPAGYGQILLKTTHPDLPQLRIDLDFAVER